MLGDVGSAQTLSFTVIGDTVNIASRLQGLTRAFGTPLVVGDAVINADPRPMKFGPCWTDCRIKGNSRLEAGRRRSVSGRCECR